MLSEAEKERRREITRQLTRREGYAALLMVGNGGVGTNSYGCFRYLVNSRVAYHLQSALFFPEHPPVAIVGSTLAREESLTEATVSDCRIYSDQVEGLIDVLRERELFCGRIGTCLELLPTAWLLRLQEVFPELVFEDITEALFQFRNHHSREEVELIRACAKLADAGYEAVLKNVRPNMTEQQIAAELEYAIQQRGGEYNFTLISAGRFGLHENHLPCIMAPSMFNRVVKEGDSIAMEITPRYQGYWTQLVRTISVGPPNEELRQMHAFQAAAIEAVLPELRPGNEIGRIAVKLREYIEEGGYVFAYPCGHICGLDLNEERIAEDNHRLLEVGMAVILHPSIITPDIQTGMFWGQTYLITEEGYERLMSSSDELMAV